MTLNLKAIRLENMLGTIKISQSARIMLYW